MDFLKADDPEFAAEFERLFPNQPTWVGIRGEQTRARILFDDGTCGPAFFWKHAQFEHANLDRLVEWLKAHRPEIFT